MKHTPEQREEWRALRKIKSVWRFLYGWRQVPGNRKQFSHQPGVILSGAPRGTHKEGACYIVRDDQSLRKISRQVFESLAAVPPISRLQALK